MKRLRRILLNVATLLSLLLCVATVVLWVRGRGASDEMWKEDRIEPGSPTAPEVLRRRSLGLRDGTLFFEQLTCYATASPSEYEGRWRHVRFPPGASKRWHWEGGFGFAYEPLPGPDEFAALLAAGSFKVGAPTWAVVAVLAFVPVARAARALGKRVKAVRRTATGLCAACGYDLRATPDKCPECGQVPTGR